MAKWCNEFNCFCNDVEFIFSEEIIEQYCELDCKHCESMQIINREDFE